MRRRRLLTRQAVALSGVLLTAASCSFLYDLDQVQCEIPKDCAGFEEVPGQTKVTCTEGICQIIDLGSGGTGNTTAPSTTSPSTTSPSTSSTTGTAGAGGTPECLENDDCIAELGNPAICRDEECIDLYSDECPIVLGTGNGNEYLKSPKVPLIFGAYAGIGDPVPQNTAMTANYEYAINQVNRYSGGGAKIGNVRYPFVAVVCDSAGDLAVSMEHLVKTLRVPAIIAGIDKPNTLLEIFEAPEYGANENNVFMMSPFGADSTLTNQDVDPNGLMWHLLGEAADRGLAYKPLVARAEAYLRAQQDIPPEEPIRVAMVVANTRNLLDIADVITNTVRFNGMSVIENEQAENFLRTTTESYNETETPNLGTAVNDLVAFEPHLVLAISSHEFVLPGMLPTLELVWDNSGKTMPPPFYLLSPYISRNGTLSQATTLERPPMGTEDNPSYIPLRQRLLVVNAAGSEDTELYDKYFSGFRSEYSLLAAEVSLDGTENFYDAAYYTMYAIHGSMAVNNITGLNVAAGMRRLVGGANTFEIGTGHVETIIGLLRNSSQSITFKTTMGLPNFNGAGSRTSLPAIGCVDQDPDNGNMMAYYTDVLRYDQETEELIGDDPCSIDGFMAEDQ